MFDVATVEHKIIAVLKYYKELDMEQMKSQF